MVKAPHPKNLLHGSLVSPTLAAAIINGKYVNAVPLYRLEKEFERYGLAITRQNMANWMIRLAENYLGVMYDYLHSLLYDYHVIQADETPVLVNKDGRPAGSKSWMWVYRSGFKGSRLPNRFVFTIRRGFSPHMATVMKEEPSSSPCSSCCLVRHACWSHRGRNPSCLDRVRAI